MNCAIRGWSLSLGSLPCATRWSQIKKLPSRIGARTFSRCTASSLPNLNDPAPAPRHTSRLRPQSSCAAAYRAGSPNAFCHLLKTLWNPGTKTVPPSSVLLSMSATTPWQCGPETWDTALVSLLKSRRFSNVKSSVGSTSAPSRALKFQGCRSRCTLGRVRHSGLSVVASPEPTGTFTVGLYTHHLS